MSTKIGQFEILSELAKSSTGAVYKANDPESAQTIALKAIQLNAFGEKASELEQVLLAEAENSKVLSSSNITKIYGAGVIEGQFCAAMEYVQGNSIATMLARKEGFSIWDLLDIGRQLCSGLDHAASNKIVHSSLEPAKIMCGWDGTVKILSFGVSSVGNFVQHAGDGMSPILHYMSPEQIRGDATDSRSNLYSLGAMFYEMVTERKAFDREDIESLRQSILESTPVAPIHVNPKVHPLLSGLIMKALAKDPAQRFQSGRDLLESLEQCKESKPAAAAKKADAPKGLTAPAAARGTAQAKFAGASAPKPAAPKPSPAVTSGSARPSAPAASAQSRPSALAKPSKLAAPKAAAAAAGIGAESISASPATAAGSSEVQEIDLSDQLVGSPVPTMDACENPAAYMSAAVADEPQVETLEPQEDSGPKIAVDPMMAEGPAATTGTSFSDISELPPLKEVYIAPPPPPPAPEEQVVQAPLPTPAALRSAKKDEKPKVQPREVAQKAIKEIKGVPPKLIAYAIGGAIALIVAIGIGVTVYVHQNSDDDAGAPRATAPADTPAPEAAQPAPEQAKAPEPTPAPAAAEPTEVPDQQESEPAQSGTSAKSHGGKKKSGSAPMVIPGQLSVDSAPQGAQVQIDGASDPSWVTPFVITNMQPGQHSITTSKAGYVTDTRTINVASAYRAAASIRLSQLMATLVIKSDPPGASIYVDSHDMGVKTPAQISVDKGVHFVLVRMSGYLDEQMSQQFVVGQTFNFAPTMRPLGNVDNIKTVNKISKLFGGGKAAQNSQGTVTIRTQPKGAQISINQHVLDKNSPVDVLLDPGNYEVDITLSGYAPVHKVVTANKGEKVVIDEVLTPQ